MNRKPCSHNVVLPKGLLCDRGYLIIRLKLDGRWHPSVHCGPHNAINEKAARLKLDDMRLKQRLGTLSIPTKAKRMKFPDVAWLWFKRHFEEYRDPNTNEGRSHITLMNTRGVVKSLCEYFEEFYFDAIKPKDVREYKTHLVEFEDLSHATFNRRKGTLSSIFSLIEQWVKTEEIDCIKLPADNPCDYVPDLSESRRERIASLQEIWALHEASLALNDGPMWNLIWEALDTHLRLGDHKKLGEVQEKDGMIVIRQNKTGKDLRLPAIQKPVAASTHVNRRNRWEAVRAKAIEILAQKLLPGCGDLQWRDLRKTGLNLKERVGASLQQQADAAGHASTKTTEQFYRTAKPDALVPHIEEQRKMYPPRV